MRQYPPFAVVLETDHTAWIIIATAIGIPIILVFGGIRLAVRQPVNIGLDDALIGGSTLVAIVQASLVLRACSYGFGKESAQIDPTLLSSIQQFYYGSNILFLISLALSKASVAALLMRLCVEKAQKKYFTGALAFVALWGLGSIFAVALQCNLSHPAILLGGQCSNILLRWQVIGGMDIAWEVLVVAMAAYLIWNLQAPLATKIQVVSAFSFRLLLIAPIALRFHTFPEARLTEDPSLSLASFVAWTQAELYWSVVSATIPSMRPFLRGLSTAETAVFENSTDPASRAEYELSKMRSGRRASRFSVKRGLVKQSLRSQTQKEVGMEPPFVGSAGKETIVERGRPQLSHKRSMEIDLDRDSVVSGSDESQRMIIPKGVAWSVGRD